MSSGAEKGLEKQEKQEKISLTAFLDIQELSRAEYSYYLKHYKGDKDELKFSNEWSKVIKITH